MSKHYVFFTRNVLPQPAAHLVHAANCANAVANLGYSSVLVYLQKDAGAFNPLKWFAPFHPRKPASNLAQFYSLQEHLQVVPLAMPWPIDRWQSKWTSSSTLACKYYFPFHIRRETKIVHSRDWNFVKAAIRNGVPAIYEHHHHENKQFETDIVRHPLLQMTITVSDPVRKSLIQNGMPAEKILKLHSGFNQVFLSRSSHAQKWRQQLIGDKKYLVVYSGGLNRFKGVDLLIDVARELPHMQFAFAGGTDSQVQAYRQLIHDKLVNNVSFLGYLQHQQLPSLLQAADILAHPHCSGEASTFTSPLKFFEYLASGTPIVATEIPPLIEFKQANIAVSWCKPNRRDQLINALQQSLTTYPRKPDGYLEQIDFARQFSWESRCSHMINCLEATKRPQALS